jgi:hypothetical protein
VNGGGCTNNGRVNRKHSETVLLDPIRKELLAPERVSRVARDLQLVYGERMRSMETKAVEQPKELQELTPASTRGHDGRRDPGGH